MAKPKILLVDSDEKSLSMMTISLKKAGFNVTSGRNGEEGWELVRTTQPDLVISDTKMPRMDGFAFCRKVKDDPAFKSIPFIFLTREKNVDDKIRGLELGVDDYLTKPIYLKEVLARVRLLLERREKEKVDFVPQDPQFSGSLQDMGVVDLIQTMELGQKTGVVYLSRSGIQSSMAFSKGRILDARVANVKGEQAVYKLLLWNDGSFRIDFKSIDDVEPTIQMSTQGLIMEGMRRIDELVRIKEQLPPLDGYLAIDSQMILEEHPDQFPEKIENILAEFTGQQTIQQVIDKLPHDDLESMEIIAKLYFQGFLMPVNAPEGAAAKESEAPLFNFAPPEEEEEESIDHIFEKDSAPARESPAKADAPEAPEEIDIDIDEPAAETAEVAAASAQAAGKAKAKQGKVIFLKGGAGAAAAAKKAEPEPEPTKPPETLLETTAIPTATITVEREEEPKPATPPQKAKPAKAKEIRMPASPPKPAPAPAPAPQAPAAAPKAPPPPAPKAPPPPPAPKPKAPPPKPAVTPPQIAAADLVPPPAPMPAAATAAPGGKSKAPLFIGVGVALVLVAGGAGFFLTRAPSAPAPAAGTAAPGSDQVEFRDSALKLTGESLDLYRGASLDMNLDTSNGYRRAIQGFEALAAQTGWSDGTDQEIVLSKLILAYARLGAQLDDPAPVAKAIELAASHLRERPGSPYLLLADAEAKVRAAKLDDAKQSLRGLGASAENFYLFNYVDGLHRLNGGGVPDLAIVSLRKALEQNPDFTLGHFELGRAYEASRRLSDARTEYLKATELSPNHAEAHYRLGAIAREQGDPATALKYAETAVAVDQSYLPAQLLLGELQYAKGLGEKAAMHARDIIELARVGKDDDLIVGAHKLLGRVALDAGDRDKARRAFELGAQVAPSDEELKMLLDGLAGAAAAPQAAAAKPAPAPAPAPKPEPVATKPAAAKGPTPQQLAAAKEAFGAAQNLYRKGMLKNAAERLQEAVKNVPTDDAAWALLGQIYIEMEKDDDALKALQKAISLNAKNAEAHVNLGGLYDAKGDTAKANASYKMYLLLEPKGRFAADIRKLLSTRR